MSKDWLVRTVDEAIARNQYHFERDILQSRLQDLHIHCYDVPELVMPIYSMDSYFKANVALLDPAVRQQLFPKNRPVYTKLRDCAPTQYGLHADVTDSLVADGAHIDGTVKNCVIFRGVTICRDAELENCVVMQDGIRMFCSARGARCRALRVTPCMWRRTAWCKCPERL